MASSGQARKSTVSRRGEKRGANKRRVEERKRNEVTRVPLELGVVVISIERRQLPT